MRSHDELYPDKSALAAVAAKDMQDPPPLCSPCLARVEDLATPPSDQDCFALWDRYAMPAHIREHSLLVARIATFLAERLAAAGCAVPVATVRASALLHDLGKDYTIRYGGNHAQLGGVWTLEETRNPLVAQGVIHHVFWPWELDITTFLVPLAVIYADKRVMHGGVANLETRFNDLFERYGRNEYIVGRIEISRRQAVALEQTFSTSLGIDLHAYSFDSGRLVE
jgi:putative nucleotidyltransferase with HDIG domain